MSDFIQENFFAAVCAVLGLNLLGIVGIISLANWVNARRSREGR